MAEGARNNAAVLATYFRDHHARLGFELRATILGHVQRGSTPSAFDRLLATRLGAGATDCMAEGRHTVVVGSVDGRIAATPMARVVGNKKPLDSSLLRLAAVLAT